MGQRCQSWQAGGLAGPAQALDFEAANEAAQHAGFVIEPRQRVLQQREQGYRGQMFDRGLCDQAKEDAGRRQVERDTGGIIDIDVPSLEFGGDAAGETAIGRHEHCGRAGCLQLLAQQQGDDACLLLGTGTVVARHAVEARGVEMAEFGPFVTDRGRSHDLADQLNSG